MTPSHKTRICLALSILSGVLAARLDANSAPSAGAAAPAVAYTAQPVQSQPATGTAVSTNAVTATSARYPDWSFLNPDNRGLAIEPPVVIPASEIDAAATTQIIEDLSIMSRIIEKNVLTPYGVKPRRLRDVFWSDYSWQTVGPASLFPSLGQPKPLYVGGYGATFFIQVDFALLPPPENAQEQPAESEDDPVWTQTKRALLEPRTAGAAPRRESAGLPYSQSKVDSFRRALIATMKHGANIRILQPDEQLVFVVQGFGSAAAGPPQDPTPGTALPVLGVMPLGRSVMTLRATKADVDAYAKGQLGQEQFEQRVQMITY